MAIKSREKALFRHLWQWNWDSVYTNGFSPFVNSWASNGLIAQITNSRNNDSTIASAVLDRLLHHADTIVIAGASFRMKDQNRIMTPIKSAVLAS